MNTVEDGQHDENVVVATQIDGNDQIEDDMRIDEKTGDDIDQPDENFDAYGTTRPFNKQPEDEVDVK